MGELEDESEIFYVGERMIGAKDDTDAIMTRKGGERRVRPEGLGARIMTVEEICGRVESIQGGKAGFLDEKYLMLSENFGVEGWCRCIEPVDIEVSTLEMPCGWIRRNQEDLLSRFQK